MNTNSLKVAIDMVDDCIAKYAAKRDAAGKDKYGVFITPFNAEVGVLNDLKTKLIFAHAETEEGINEAIDKAQTKGVIGYAAVHSVSPSSYQLYEYSSKSPSGRFQLGSVTKSPLSEKILHERGILKTLSNAEIR